MIVAPPVKSYRIRSRYLVSGEGWKIEETVISATYEGAGYAASRVARSLDRVYGGSHFWTVDLYSVDAPEHGSFYQLFHGRLS
jgi:hypothetical protein